MWRKRCDYQPTLTCSRPLAVSDAQCFSQGLLESDRLRHGLWADRWAARLDCGAHDERILKAVCIHTEEISSIHECSPWVVYHGVATGLAQRRRVVGGLHLLVSDNAHVAQVQHGSDHIEDLALRVSRDAKVIHFLARDTELLTVVHMLHIED